MPTPEEQAVIERNERIAAANRAAADRAEGANAGPAAGATGGIGSMFGGEGATGGIEKQNDGVQGTNSASVNAENKGDVNAHRDPAKNLEGRSGEVGGESKAAAERDADDDEDMAEGSFFSRTKTNLKLPDGSTHHIRLGHQRLPKSVAAMEYVTGEKGICCKSSDISEEESADFQKRMDMGLLGTQNDGFSGPVVNIPHGVAVAGGYHDSRHMARCGGGIQAFGAPSLGGSQESEAAEEAEDQAGPDADPVVVPTSNRRMDRRGGRGR